MQQNSYCMVGRNCDTQLALAETNGEVEIAVALPDRVGRASCRSANPQSQAALVEFVRSTERAAVFENGVWLALGCAAFAMLVLSFLLV